MHVTIRGKRWELKFEELEDCRGACDSPKMLNKAIRVDSRLEGEECLEVLIHEATHSAHWDMDEEAVEEFAVDLAKMLWRLGYRREHGQPKT